MPLAMENLHPIGIQIEVPISKKIYQRGLVTGSYQSNVLKSHNKQIKETAV